MKQFFEMTNKYGYRSYINANHILSVDEPYDVVVGKILQLNEE